MASSKIEKFVAEIAEDALTEGQQSLILSTNEIAIGGDNVKGNCTNRNVTACSGTNDKCTNYGTACGTSTNKKACVNGDDDSITIGPDELP